MSKPIKKIDTEDLKCRVKRLCFSLNPLESWAVAAIIAQLPEDAMIINASIDHATMRWNLFVRSEKFEKVSEGAIVPEIISKVDRNERKVELVTPAGTESFLSDLGVL